MNFLGHAVAARWSRSDPEFVLGAMLPDFAAMVGDRLVEVGGAALAAGVDHHHRADRAFHRLEAFRLRWRDLTARLQRRGVARGGALAAGHVGVELLLDGVLLDEQRGAPALFSAALARAPLAAAAIEWRGAGAGRFAALIERLGDAGSILDGYRDPEVVADRLLRILSRRPRLRIEAARRRDLVLELGRERAEIAAVAPALFGELRRELGCEPPAEAC